jgi:hypothetical protein
MKVQDAGLEIVEACSHICNCQGCGTSFCSIEDQDSNNHGLHPGVLGYAINAYAINAIHITGQGTGRWWLVTVILCKTCAMKAALRIIELELDL